MGPKWWLGTSSRGRDSVLGLILDWKMSIPNRPAERRPINARVSSIVADPMTTNLGSISQLHTSLTTCA
jgi:hypothetical protein